MQKRVVAGWSGWIQVSGVICDRIAVSMKKKVYKMTVALANKKKTKRKKTGG